LSRRRRGRDSNHHTPRGVPGTESTRAAIAISEASAKLHTHDAERATAMLAEQEEDAPRAPCWLEEDVLVPPPGVRKSLSGRRAGHGTQLNGLDVEKNRLRPYHSMIQPSSMLQTSKYGECGRGWDPPPRVRARSVRVESSGPGRPAFARTQEHETSSCPHVHVFHQRDLIIMPCDSQKSISFTPFCEFNFSRRC